MTTASHAFIVPLLALILALAGCARKAPATEPDAGGSLAPDWSETVDAAAGVQVVGVPGGFLVATPAGVLRKLGADDGIEAWKADVGARIAGGVVIGTGAAGREDADVAAVPLEGGDVEIVALHSGSRVARLATGWDAVSLAATRDRVLAVSGSGLVRLYAAGEETPRWETRLPSPPSAAPTVCAGRLFVGMEDGRIAGLDLETGETRTRKNLGSPALVRPECSGNRLFVATADNEFHALRLYRRHAALKWRVRSGADPAAPAGTFKGNVLFPSKDTFLYAFQKGNGHLVFRARLDRRPGPTAILDDLVFVAGPQSTRLDAFRLPEGRGAGSFTLPEAARFISAPAVSGRHVAIALARYGEETSRVVGLGPRKTPSPAAPSSAPN